MGKIGFGGSHCQKNKSYSLTTSLKYGILVRVPPKKSFSVGKIEYYLLWVPVGHLSYVGGILTPNRNGLATSYFKATKGSEALSKATVSRTLMRL